ncbi:MAG: EAL domain-containing protein [Alphaproteobacteria bacterium]|nr:EAL domain-containing protein [Alphaproteobacteria bacterium]
MRRIFARLRRGGQAHGGEAVLGNEAIDRALEEGQFGIAGQPLIRLGDAAILGGEAYARWRHPALGELAAAGFLPLLDAQGRACELTRIVLDEALAWAAAWARAGRDWRIALNLGPGDLLDTTFLPALEQRLNCRDLAPDRLVLDLPARFLLEAPLGALSTYRGLRALGVGIALDGPPIPLPALETLAPGAGGFLKLHRRHVPGFDAEDDPLAAQGVAELMTGARARGLGTVLVGLETEGELDKAEGLGFSHVMGHHLCPAVGYGGFEAWARLWAGEALGPALIERDAERPPLADAPHPVHAMQARLRALLTAEAMAEDGPAHDPRAEATG